MACGSSGGCECAGTCGGQALALAPFTLVLVPPDALRPIGSRQPLPDADEGSPHEPAPQAPYEEPVADDPVRRPPQVPGDSPEPGPGGGGGGGGGGDEPKPCSCSCGCYCREHTPLDRKLPVLLADQADWDEDLWLDRGSLPGRGPITPSSRDSGTGSEESKSFVGRRPPPSFLHGLSEHGGVDGGGGALHEGPEPDPGSTRPRPGNWEDGRVSHGPKDFNPTATPYVPPTVYSAPLAGPPSQMLFGNLYAAAIGSGAGPGAGYAAPAAPWAPPAPGGSGSAASTSPLGAPPPPPSAGGLPPGLGGGPTGVGQGYTSHSAAVAAAAGGGGGGGGGAGAPGPGPGGGIPGIGGGMGFGPPPGPVQAGGSGLLGTAIPESLPSAFGSRVPSWSEGVAVPAGTMVSPGGTLLPGPPSQFGAGPGAPTVGGPPGWTAVSPTPISPPLASLGVASAPRAPDVRWVPWRTNVLAMPVIGSDTVDAMSPRARLLGSPGTGETVEAAGLGTTTLAPPDSMRLSHQPRQVRRLDLVAPADAGSFWRGGTDQAPGAGAGAADEPASGDGSLASGARLESQTPSVGTDSGSLSDPSPRRSATRTASWVGPPQQGAGSFDLRPPTRGQSAPADGPPVRQTSFAPPQTASASLAGEVDGTAGQMARPQRNPKVDVVRPPKPPSFDKTEIGPPQGQRGGGGGGLGALATSLARKDLLQREAVEIPKRVLGNERAKHMLEQTGVTLEGLARRRDLQDRTLLELQRSTARRSTVIDALERKGGDKSDSEWHEYGALLRSQSADAKALEKADLALRETEDIRTAVLKVLSEGRNPDPQRGLAELSAGLSDKGRADLEDVLGNELQIQTLEQELAADRQREASLAEGIGQADETLAKEVASLARQMGLSQEDVWAAVFDPDSSLGKRMDAETKWRRDLEEAKAQRAKDRSTRLRSGEERARIEHALQASRAVRDQATSGSAALTRARGAGISRSDAREVKRLMDKASRVAKDAARVAHEARRTAQYGTKSAAEAAADRATVEAAQAQIIGSAVTSYTDALSKLESRMASPHADPTGQQALEGMAKADLAIAKAELEGAVTGKDAASLSDAKQLKQEAVAKFMSALKSGHLSLSDTIWPECKTLPAPPPDLCCDGVSCPTETGDLVTYWRMAVTRECYGVGEEDGGGKGKGPPSPEHERGTTFAPEVEPEGPVELKPVRDSATAARGGIHKDATLRDFIWESYTSRPFFRTFGFDPDQPSVLGLPGEFGVLAAPPESAAPGESAVSPEASVQTALDVREDPNRRLTEEEIKAEFEAEVERRFNAFVVEMRGRQHDTSAHDVTADTAIFGPIVNGRRRGGNADKIKKLIETRIMSDEAVGRLALELGAGVTAKRRREITMELERIKLGDAVANFQMVELAGGRNFVGVVDDAIRLVEAAQSAERVHMELGSRDHPEFMALVSSVMTAGGAPDGLDLVLTHPPERQFDKTGKLRDPERYRRWRAAKSAYDKATGPGAAVDRFWKSSTGGRFATPWQRAAILAGTLAIGAITGGAGVAVAAGRGLATAVVTMAVAGGAGGLLIDAYTQAIVTEGFTKGDWDAKQTLKAGLIGAAFGAASGIPLASAASPYAKMSMTGALGAYGRNSVNQLASLGRVALETAKIGADLARSGAKKVVVAVPVQATDGVGLSRAAGQAVRPPPGPGGIVAIPRRLTPSEMEALQVKHGVEFAQIYRLGPGPSGRGGQYFLIRGEPASVPIPIRRDVIWIGHTHPAIHPRGGRVPLRPSDADWDVLSRLRGAGSPQNRSMIVPEGSAPFYFGY